MNSKKFSNKKKSKKYYPRLTSLRRFRGFKRKNLRASETLIRILSSLGSKANQVFDDFFFQTFQTQFEIYEQGARWPFWRRLIVSRIFYLYFSSELYTRSRFTPFKSGCLESEKNAIKRFGLSGEIFLQKLNFLILQFCSFLLHQMKFYWEIIESLW